MRKNRKKLGQAFLQIQPLPANHPFHPPEGVENPSFRQKSGKMRKNRKQLVQAFLQIQPPPANHPFPPYELGVKTAPENTNFVGKI